jgi:hypothetical protein
MSTSSIITILLLTMAVFALWSIRAEVAKTDEQRKAEALAQQEREQERERRHRRLEEWKWKYVGWWLWPIATIWLIWVLL